MIYDWRAIQTRLRDVGFDPGPIDGIRGPRTDAAIVAFKRSVGLWPRPFYGPITHAALMQAAPETASASARVPWMAEAKRMQGLHEARDTSALRAWFDRSVAWIDPREVPWCGAFTATVMRKWRPAIHLPQNPLGARNWMQFGKECPPVFGSVLVFWRVSRTSWQGHVAFYYGEDGTHYHVLGGNQTNAITVTRIAKSRLLGARWPLGEAVTGKPIFLNAAGVPVSTNEA